MKGADKVRSALCKLEYEGFRHLRNIKKYTHKGKIFLNYIRLNISVEVVNKITVCCSEIGEMNNLLKFL